MRRTCAAVRIRRNRSARSWAPTSGLALASLMRRYNVWIIRGRCRSVGRARLRADPVRFRANDDPLLLFFLLTSFSRQLLLFLCLVIVCLRMCPSVRAAGKNQAQEDLRPAMGVGLKRRIFDRTVRQYRQTRRGNAGKTYGNRQVRKQVAALDRATAQVLSPTRHPHSSSST